MNQMTKFKTDTTPEMVKCLLDAIDKLKHMHAGDHYTVEAEEFEVLLALLEQYRNQKPVAKRKKDADLPSWLPEDLWWAYVDTRKSMKKHPMSKPSLDLTIISIAKTRDAGYDVLDIMEALIENGWRTVKPTWMATRLKPDAHETIQDRARRLQLEMIGDNVPTLGDRS